MPATMDLESPGFALGTKWVVAYTDFVFSVVGLRRMLDGGYRLGVSQALFADKARGLLELEDELNGQGLSPALVLAGEEELLWQATARFGLAACREVLSHSRPLSVVIRAVEECQQSWASFLDAVAKLPDTFGQLVAVMDPDALQPERLRRLFHERLRYPACERHEAGEAVGQHVDEPVLR